MTATLSPGNASAASAVAKPRKKSRSLKWWVIGGIVLFLVLVALAMAKGAGNKVGVGVTTDVAVRKSIIQTVTATGKVQPEVEVKITPEVFGEIISLPYREGASIKKGQEIVKIKPDFYQAQVDQQTAAVAAARAAAVNSQVQLEKAETDLTKYQDLYDRKLISEFDYVTYKTNYDAAKANRASALAQVDEAEGFLKQAKDSLSKTSIYSPMDGTVSSRSSEVGERVQSGAEFPGTEIMRVADLSKMEVRVKVNENDIVNVKVGDAVAISIDAYPDRKFSGYVREIAASADNNGASGSGSTAQAQGSVSDEVTNFIVKIRISDKDATLRPGMSATADIKTQTVENAVAIPIQSVTVRAAGGMTAEQIAQKKAKELHERSGNDLDVADDKIDAKRDQEKLLRVVFVRAGDKVRMQTVETGIADNTMIEIKSGIKPGDEVVSGTYAAISRLLKDGSKIHIEKPKTDIAENK
ncbi:MAG TPA: efflux RND transporter periplasmic adaptor subunit [Opitutaceae bacterium]